VGRSTAEIDAWLAETGLGGASSSATAGQQ
jgi:hypothetical protein